MDVWTILLVRNIFLPATTPENPHTLFPFREDLRYRKNPDAEQMQQG
jgi:hypothetical protein